MNYMFCQHQFTNVNGYFTELVVGCTGKAHFVLAVGLTRKRTVSVWEGLLWFSCKLHWEDPPNAAVNGNPARVF